MAKKLRPGALAPSGQAVDIQGQPVMLEALWDSGPTLLTFLRHFG